jgi:hypothetical protein
VQLSDLGDPRDLGKDRSLGKVSRPFEETKELTMHSPQH